jgi:hypothetical protein
MASLGAGRFVVVAARTGSTGGDVYVCTYVSGTLSCGATQTFTLLACAFPAVAALDSTRFVFVFNLGTLAGAGSGVGQIGVVSGSTVAFGTAVTFNSASAKYNSISGTLSAKRSHSEG